MDIKSWFEKKIFKNTKNIPSVEDARKEIPLGRKEVYDMSKVTIGDLPWKKDYDKKFVEGDPQFRANFPWENPSTSSNRDNIVQTEDGIDFVMHKDQSVGAVMLSNFKFKYGTVRALIKLPNIDRVWSAFWLFKDMPELDIFEHCGQWDNQVNVTHHWGCSYENGNKKSTLHNERFNKVFKPSEEFYLYEVEVTPYTVIYRINGITVRKMVTGIPSHNTHIIFNIGPGKHYCGRPLPTEDAVMSVKWLEVYHTC